MSHRVRDEGNADGLEGRRTLDAARRQDRE